MIQFSIGARGRCTKEIDHKDLVFLLSNTFDIHSRTKILVSCNKGTKKPHNKAGIHTPLTQRGIIALESYTQESHQLKETYLKSPQVHGNYRIHKVQLD